MDIFMRRNFRFSSGRLLTPLRWASCCLIICAFSFTLLSQQAMADNCQRSVVGRLNFAIGLYRLEIAASHIVDQYQTARSDRRREQLDQANSSLKNLNATLQKRLKSFAAKPDGNGVCPNMPQALTQIYQTLDIYHQTVQNRWRFAQSRLVAIKQLRPGQSLQWDPVEARLWVEEPRARYDVWRSIAQANPQGTEVSSALFVMGMLTRTEWHTAMAMQSSLDQATSNNVPYQHLMNAVKDTQVLLENWPSSNGDSNNSLWSNLQTIAKATPTVDAAKIPKSTPPEGWTVWIGKWLQGYSSTFMRSIPKVLSALEDVAGQKGSPN